jgi:hypothetical protein
MQVPPACLGQRAAVQDPGHFYRRTLNKARRSISEPASVMRANGKRRRVTHSDTHACGYEVS